MKHQFSLAAFAGLTLSAASLAHEPGSIRADNHAPIGVMADHTHRAGEFMVSYRFMRMDMDGSRDGSDEVGLLETLSFPQVANPMMGLRVVPISMTMDMHMFGAMYAPSDRLTLAVMANYHDNEMDHITFQGMMGGTQLGRFTTASSGWGDVTASALIGLRESETSLTHVQLGLSLPMGSIDENAQVLTPMNTTPTLTLPYAMQLGSGTFDPIIGLTHVMKPAMHWRVGVQGTAKLRFHDNDADYRLGDDVRGTAWVSYSPIASWSFSGRVEARSWGEIEGQDARITAPVQTADPANYGGETLYAGLGVNWAEQDGALRGHRFAAELNTPLHRDPNGPQLETDWTLTLGWQFAFGS